MGAASGKVELGLKDSNVWPWCIVQPSDAEELAVAEQFLRAALGEGPLPFCPQEYLAEKTSGDPALEAEWEQLLKRWTLRGAANGGLAVYSYLDDMFLNKRDPQPNYDRCEDRPSQHR